MAVTRVDRTIQDTPQYVSRSISFYGDVSTQLTDVVIFDASALAGAKNIGKIVQISGSVSGCVVKLSFDATTDDDVILLVPGTYELCFNELNGGFNTAAGAGKTGDLLLTTIGLAGVTTGATLIISCKKE